MAKQTINIGSSVNKGDGDPLRTAFDKVNDNFDELYARDLNTDTQTLSLDGNSLSISNGNSVELNISPTGDLTGSVFADDSTLLVDGVNGVIPYSVLDGSPTALSDFSNDLDYASIVGSAIQNNGLPILPTQTLDIKGSVFADDSTVLIDGVEGKVFGDINTNTITASSGNLTITADNYVYIDSINNGQINIGTSSGIGDILLGDTANGTNVQILGRLFVKGGGVPATSKGSSGDFEGIFAVDDNYIYYCTATYTDGIADIWKRVAWSADTW